MNKTMNRIVDTALLPVLRVTLTPVLFTFEVFTFGFSKALSRSSTGQWVDRKFWENFGWQPNGPPR